MSGPDISAGKKSIQKRFSVIIYKMSDNQLLSFLALLRAFGIKGENRLLEVSRLNPEDLSFPDDRQLLIAHIFVLIKQLSYEELAGFLDHFEEEQFRGLREYPRISCNLKVDFTLQGKSVSCFARDISAGGIYIETDEKILMDQVIYLSFNGLDKEMDTQIQGKVVRMDADGIGVRYEKLDNDQKEKLGALIEKIKT